MNCTICSQPMRPDVLADTYRCSSCGFFSSTFPVAINEGARLDETLRERALKPIRIANFRRMLDACATIFPPSARLLDVGAAHGWFLEEARAHGYQAIGLEPDTAMAKIARDAGHDVLEGFFPDALPSGSAYDVITFNDVFEHLEHLDAMLDAIHMHLEGKGVLVINIPISNGPIFTLARTLAKLGMTGPLVRLWQRGLPSPHLNYFSSRTLKRLVERHGFTLVHHGRLESIAIRGLYERIKYDTEMSTATAILTYLAAVGMKVVTGMFPSDIQYFVFKKNA